MSHSDICTGCGQAVQCMCEAGWGEPCYASSGWCDVCERYGKPDDPIECQFCFYAPCSCGHTPTLRDVDALERERCERLAAHHEESAKALRHRAAIRAARDGARQSRLDHPRQADL